MFQFGKFEDEFDRPASAAAVFSCLGGGSMNAGRASRPAEIEAIAAWLADHAATTEIAQPRRAAAPKRGLGRPPKAGERFPCGDLRPADDAGTEEHRAKRLRLVGAARDTRTPQRIARHEALASCPLGVLYARRKILSGEHYAGRRYAALFVKAVRPATLPSVLANLVSGGSMPMAMALLDEVAGTETDPHTGEQVPYGTVARAAYLAAREALDRRGPMVAQAIDDLVIYERAPRTQRRLEVIQDGLDALKTHFDLVDERSAAARA